MFALKYGLAKWQEEKFAELEFELMERDAAIHESIDFSSADPEEVEARFSELDQYEERRKRELVLLVAPEIYAEIYGED